jgi:hypothetical protein
VLGTVASPAPGLWVRLAQGAGVIKFCLEYSWCTLMHDTDVCACYSVVEGEEKMVEG